MAFILRWVEPGTSQYNALKEAAQLAKANREAAGDVKASPPEGKFKQVHKALQLLVSNPRHPGLCTHKYDSLPHPWDGKQKVFEAYAQNKTPGAYRVFWCYGKARGEITIIAITPHP